MKIKGRNNKLFYNLLKSFKKVTKCPILVNTSFNINGPIVETPEEAIQVFLKAKKKYLKVVVNYDGPINAPIKKDDVLADLKIYYKDEFIEEHNLYASENIEKLNIFSRLILEFFEQKSSGQYTDLYRVHIVFGKIISFLFIPATGTGAFIASLRNGSPSS